MLKQKLKGEEEPTVSLHVHRTVPMEEVVKVMNIAKDNRYKLILATQALK
jgi:biopolymer transport protein ExbD